MPGDQTLIQIGCAGLAEAARKAGRWLACRRGCFECCLGSFAISSRDVDRLREGMASIDGVRAVRVRERAVNYSGAADDEPNGITATVSIAGITDTAGASQK